MTMYKLFSCNMEIQYKSYFLSKAMLFTLFTTVLNILLPFLVAYRSRGFWLRSESFYERPLVRFSYDYLLLIETEDAANVLICSNLANINDNYEEWCADFQVEETPCHNEDKNCKIKFKFHVNLPPDSTIVSVTGLFGIDFQLMTVCPLHMQSLVELNKEFTRPASALKYYSDLDFHQIKHLPCLKNTINVHYNQSIFSFDQQKENLIDQMIKKNFEREYTTQLKTLHSKATFGHTGFVDLEISIRIPSMQILYTPNILQELKWAWPQYLSLGVVFYWIINKIKRFVFNNRLLMAWEVMPWKNKS